MRSSILSVGLRNGVGVRAGVAKPQAAGGCFCGLIVRAFVTGICLCAAGLTASAEPPDARAAAAIPSVATQPATTQPGRVVLFQPNVRIDYAKRQVEVDGAVTLREGLLELFACSPGTREYESIVRLDTRPVAVFQALGLLGLEPGHPLRMDPKTLEIIPPAGDAVAIEVQYEADGIRKTVPIENWMRHSRTKAALERQAWVFAGSIRLDNGGIAADEEGTIVAVVDFESALVTVPRLHTAANAELWLEPNTPAIPEVGTRCTVIFRPGPLLVRLDHTGRLYLGSKPVTFAEATRRLRSFARENPTLAVDVEIGPDSPAPDREQLERMIEALEIRVNRRAITRPAATSPAGEPAREPEDAQSSAKPSNAVPRWLLGQVAAKSDNSPTATQPADETGR
jgi:hypothetical protein